MYKHCFQVGELFRSVISPSQCHQAVSRYREHDLEYKDVFEKWGIDVMCHFPVTQRGKSYLLTMVDYLTRWVKAKVVKQITSKDVEKIVY